MATDVERLVVSLEANIKKYERELARSRGVTDSALRGVERSVSNSANKIEGSMARVGASIRGGIAVALAGISVGKLTELTDAFTKVQNSLKVNGLEGAKLTETYRQLFDIAQKQGVPLEGLSEVYSKAATAQKELNASSADLVMFTNAVAVALRAGAVGSVQADQALQQLGQALASGKVEWEELSSVVDSAPTIMQAAAAGIKEAGGSVGKLTALVKDGKVSSEALFRAIIAGLPAVQSLADKTDETSAQGLTRLKNSLIDLVGALDKSSGASNAAVSAMSSVSSAIDRITASIPGAISALSSYFEKLSKAPYFQSLVQSIGDTEGGNTPASAASPFTRPANRLEGAFSDAKLARAGSLAGMEDALKRRGAGEVARPKPAVKPISLKDFKVPGDDKDKKGGGGGGKSENEYQREIKNIKERTAALQNEATTVGQSEGQIARSETAFKLLEAAKKANVDITPQLKADIEAVSSAMGTATQKLHEAEEANRRFQSEARNFGSTLSDGFKDAILEGEKLVNVMGKLLKSLAGRGIDSIFDGLFGKTGAGTALLKGAGGGLGGLISGITGRAGGGPVKPGTAYTVGESGRETFVPTTPGRIIPAGRGGRSGPSVRMGDTIIDARGADAGVEQRLRALVAAQAAESRRTIGNQLASWKENA